MVDVEKVKVALQVAEDYFRIHGYPTVQLGRRPTNSYRVKATLRNVRDHLREALEESDG